MNPQESPKNNGGRYGAEDSSKNPGPARKYQNQSGGHRYNKNLKERDGKDREAKAEQSAAPDRNAKGKFARPPANDGEAGQLKPYKQPKDQAMPKQERQIARTAAKSPSIKDAEPREQGAAAARAPGHAAQKAPVIKNRQPHERAAQGGQDGRIQDGRAGQDGRTAQDGREQAPRGQAAGGAAGGTAGAGVGAGSGADHAGETATARNPAGSGSAGASAGIGSAGHSAGNTIGTHAAGNTASAAHIKAHNAQSGAGAAGPGAGAGIAANAGAGAGAGTGSGTGAGSGAGSGGTAGMGRGRHAQSAHAPKIKAEETLEDIKDDIVRLEKEIGLEIKEIQSLKLAL